VAILAALFIVWLVTFVLRLRRRGAVSGRASIVGGVGTAEMDFTGEGKIWLEGESWTARSNVPIEKDQKVIVRSLVGLILEVEPTRKT
jgi:membrane-bound serine protease (ClpP class)